jgi:hypothetical protein
MNEEVSGELMEEIQVVINGKETRGQKDMTILQPLSRLASRFPRFVTAPISAQRVPVAFVLWRWKDRERWLAPVTPQSHKG